MVLATDGVGILFSSDEPIVGCDVSFLQKLIDWERASNDVSFAYIRWGQRDVWEDSYAVTNWRGARSNHVYRGMYWVWDQREGANAEGHLAGVRRVLAKVNGDKGELPPIIDLQVQPVDWDELKKFVEGLEELFGVEPWIYSGAWFLRRIKPLPEWFTKLSFWLTGYNDEGPTILEGYDLRIRVWQQSNSWQVSWTPYGVVDRDYWFDETFWEVVMGKKVIDVDVLTRLIEENAYELDEQPEPPEPPEPPPPPTVGGFSLIWPTDYQVITQPYAANPQYYNQFGLPGHEGLDIRALMGTPVYAAAAGEVYRVEPAPAGAYGIQVRIRHEHPDGIFKTIYAHLEAATVQVGDRVAAGKQIGLADNTGNSSGSHLHLTLKKEGQPADAWMPQDIVDPTPYFKELFPGQGWRVTVFGNFRSSPEVADNKIDGGLTVGTIVNAIEVEGEWWKVERANVSGNSPDGWFWNPGYKLKAL